MSGTRRQMLAGLAATAAAILPARFCFAQQGPPPLTPEMFGAKGDGRTDDTAAFQRLSDRLNANDGGEVDLRPGAIYLAGRQTRDSSQYLRPWNILHVRNVARLVVRMNGATIRFLPGLKLGAFDPRTGLSRRGPMPHLDRSTRADIGAAISVQRVGFVSISGGTIDCNSNGMIIGGEWGDTGWQCNQFGIVVHSCPRTEISNMRVLDSCQDGILYGYAGISGASPRRPLVMRDVTVDRAARNCVSIVGTNQALIERCTFRRGGEAPNARIGSFRSAPAACIDIEAEDAECRNVVIRDSRLIAGAKTYNVFVADTGPSRDLLVEDTLLVGRVWTSKPATTFRRCQLFGVFTTVRGGQKVADDNTRIIDCTVTDATQAGSPLADAHHIIDLEAASPGVQISGTTFSVSRMRLNFRGGILDDVTVNFATGTNKIEDGDFAFLLDGARIRGLRVNERIPPALRPASAYYITRPASATDAILTSPAMKVLWGSWSPGAGGHTGRYRG